MQQGRTQYLWRRAPAPSPSNGSGAGVLICLAGAGQHRAGPVAVVVAVAVTGVPDDKVQDLAAGGRDVDVDGRRRPVDSRSRHQRLAIEHHAERYRAGIAVLVVHPDGCGELAASAAEIHGDVAYRVGAQSFGVHRAVDGQRLAVMGLVAAYARVPFDRAPTVCRRQPLQVADLVLAGRRQRWYGLDDALVTGCRLACALRHRRGGDDRGGLGQRRRGGDRPGERGRATTSDLADRGRC